MFLNCSFGILIEKTLLQDLYIKFFWYYEYAVKTHENVSFFRARALKDAGDDVLLES